MQLLREVTETRYPIRTRFKEAGRIRAFSDAIVGRLIARFWFMSYFRVMVEEVCSHFSRVTRLSRAVYLNRNSFLVND